jgi:hypothetical protein
MNKENYEQMGDAIDFLADHPDIKDLLLKKHPEKQTEVETEIKERKDVSKFLNSITYTLQEEVAKEREDISKILNSMSDTLEEIVAYEMQGIERSFLPSEEKDISYTESVDEWIQKIKSIDIECSNKRGTGMSEYRIDETFYGAGCTFNFDYEIVKEASGYITTPVFKHNGILNTASFKSSKTLQGIKDYLKDKKYLLFMIVSFIRTRGVVGDNSFKQYTLEEPEMRYVFRGHILE